MISIIIPTFGNVVLLTDMVNSIIQQTYNNWELLLIDDGSSEKDFIKISELCKTDKRIILLRRNREPKGAQTCRNIGIEQSKGDYIVFLIVMI